MPTPRATSSSRSAPLLAAIDIGSNAVRFALARLGPRGSLQVLEERRRPTRLGANLASGGPLPKAGVKAAIAAAKEFCFDALRHKVAHIRVVATAAVREAPDGPQFVERLRREIGLPVEIIGPDEEARLAFASCRAAFSLENETVAVVDIGGGSAQVALAWRGVLYESISLPLGAVRLTETFRSPGRPITPPQLEKLRKHAARVIKEHLERPPLRPVSLIGCGGTFATIGALAGDFSARRPLAPMIARPSRTLRSAGHAVADLREVCDEVCGLTLEKRADLLKKAQVPPDRADILPAGLLVAMELCKRLRVERIVPHAGGVRDGILREMGSAQEPGPLVQLTRTFAQRALYERRHSEHVAHLAVALLHELAELPALRDGLADCPHASELLESAGLVHDLGVPIDYPRHHKVSRRIVELAHWPGVRADERALIANIARYHRKSLPAMDHAHFAALPRRSRQHAQILAGILRIADGLDRPHDQAVHGLHAKATRAGLVLFAEGAPAGGPALRAAQKKADLLQKVLRRPVILRPEPDRIRVTGSK